MSALLDTSVVVASIDPDEPQHAACDRLLSQGKHVVYIHALAETFSILTGGAGRRRLSAAIATKLLEESVLPFVRVQTLTAKDVMAAFAGCEARGVRGGAVYDLLHLIAARKAGAERLITLNGRDFQAFARSGDPAVEAP